MSVHNRFFDIKLFLVLLATLVAFAFTPTPSQAGGGMPSSFFDLDEVSWSSIRNASSSDFGDYFDDKSAEGYLVIDLDVLEIGGNQRVHAVWQKNIDGRNWASWRNLNSSEFHDKWTELKDDGYRLIDQEAYVLNGNLYYAGVWLENKEGLGWFSNRNLSSQQFSDKLADGKEIGYIPTDMEAYYYNGNWYYSLIMVDNAENLGWALWRNLSASQLNNYMVQYQDNYRVLDIESYQSGSSQLYAAIWITNPNGRDWEMRRDLNSTQFGYVWRDMADLGYRLIDQDVYNTSSGTRYAGVWRQNSDRPDWQYRAQTQDTAASAMIADSIPGMAVAVAQDNQFKFIRGFGFADIAAGKPASSWTMFRLASVSKAVAGVLALDMQEFGSIDLSENIQTYVPELANDHTYTVEQTITNRSGVEHYSGLGSPPDGANYSSALAALGYWNYFIGNSNDLAFTTPGSGYYYSTHAYTVLGAALEDATGSPIDSLINNWTAFYGLNNLVVENINVSNPERAQIYANSNTSNVVISRDNLSWKRLGGGLEANIVDLTQFGMNILDGDILTQNSIDTMWTAPDGFRNYGYGWDLGTDNCLDWAAKAGGQPGSDSYILIYPEVELVISVLTNRNNPHDATTIAFDIADPIVDDLCRQIPTITSISPPDGTVGIDYLHRFAANGQTPISYSLTEGTLPDGLTINGNAITGTPTNGGRFNGVITASNSIGSDTQAFSINIAAPPSITSSKPANAALGEPYSHTYTATGDTPITFSVSNGALPNGLTLSGSTISGTPTTEGVFNGVVTATNSAGTDTQTFNIVVGNAPQRVHPAYGQTLNARNAAGWPAFTFEHIPGVEWYGMWIGNADTTGLYQWFPASDSSTGATPGDGICDPTNRLCTLPVDVWLPDGDYSWWMTYWGPNDYENHGQYWNESVFSVDFDTPAPGLSNVTPNGTVNTAPTEVTWDTDPNVMWMHIWLGQVSGPDGSPYTAFYGWVDMTNICNATTCTLDLNGDSLPDGEYQMWVEMWGPDGYLNWTDANGTTPSATFTVGNGS
jgi:CubicO group peptidase (beta-lactamase class C family)